MRPTCRPCLEGEPQRCTGWTVDFDEYGGGDRWVVCHGPGINVRFSNFGSWVPDRHGGAS